MGYRRTGIVSLANFKKDKTQQQRFIYKNTKDADDMGHILANYLEIHRESSLEYYDVEYPENHTELTGGGNMLSIHAS